MLSQSLYVVRLLSVEHVDNRKDGRPKPVLYLVFEYLDTDLKKFIDSHRKGSNPRPLAPSLIRNFLYQLCKGVAHCHSHGVLHRDLKPQNLLLDKERGILKIADLGLGRAFTIPLRATLMRLLLCGIGPLRSCLAPPITLLLLICGPSDASLALFPGDSEFQQLLHIFRLLGTPTENEWRGVTSFRDWHVYPQWQPQNLARAVPSLGADGVDLLSKMLKYDPAERISAKAALDHPYFDSLDKDHEAVFWILNKEELNVRDLVNVANYQRVCLLKAPQTIKDANFSKVVCPNAWDKAIVEVGRLSKILIGQRYDNASLGASRENSERARPENGSRNGEGNEGKPRTDDAGSISDVGGKMNKFQPRLHFLNDTKATLKHFVEKYKKLVATLAAKNGRTSATSFILAEIVIDPIS
uniref:cyclin-dependent kinase n=1 Tax=Cannabis sativa TaxID=3483 RepID=A0A803PCJ6_CANSA